MSYASFKNKWIGKRIDYDGVYGYQCVDLIKQYMNEEFAMKPGAWGNAIDYWNKTHPAILLKFDKVASTNAIQGDVVIFYGHSGNPYGHIGVVESQTSTRIVTLEQNGSTGNGSGTGNDAIRTRAISKSRVAGLLRPKKSTGEQPMTKAEEANAYKIVLNRAMEHSGSGRTGYQFIVAADAELKAQRNATQKVIDTLTKERNDARKQIVVLTSEKLKLTDQLNLSKIANDALKTELSETISTYDARIEELNKVVKIKDNEIEKLLKDLETCENSGGDCADKSGWALIALGIKKLFGKE